MSLITTLPFFEATVAPPCGVYSGKSLDTSGEDGSPRGITFSADGSKVYLVGNGSNTIYQYNLTTPWDISTASYSTLSKAVGAEDSFPSGIVFSPDGTKMYILANSTDKVYQYNLTTAWNVSTASYSGLNSYFGTQDGNWGSLGISSDGTKMYGSGLGLDRIYQYTLSTPFDGSSATYSGLFLDVNPKETLPVGFAISSDGGTVFVSGLNSDSIHRYTLTIPWDMSSGSWSGCTFSVAAQDGASQGLAMSADKTKAYMVGTITDQMYQYTVTL